MGGFQSAADLTVNGVPASAVTGTDEGPYVFTVTPPGAGTVDVVLAAKQISSAESVEGIDFESIAMQKLAIDAERADTLQPEVEERMSSLMQALS